MEHFCRTCSWPGGHCAEIQILKILQGKLLDPLVCNLVELLNVCRTCSWPGGHCAEIQILKILQGKLLDPLVCNLVELLNVSIRLTDWMGDWGRNK